MSDFFESFLTPLTGHHLWTIPKLRCGSGKQTRSKQVTAKFGGNNCMGSSNQDCNTQNLYENKKQLMASFHESGKHSTNCW